jgi:hypothetical protein
MYLSNIFLTDEEMKYQSETRHFLQTQLSLLANEIEKTDRYPREIFSILKPTGSLGALIPEVRRNQSRRSDSFTYPSI